MQTAKAQISLRMHAVWAGPSLSAIRIIWHVRMYVRENVWMILCTCAGWSESAYFAHLRRHVFAWYGLYECHDNMRHAERQIVLQVVPVCLKTLWIFSLPQSVKCRLRKSITKTRLYNFDPLKPHFYIVKLGFTGVYIIFLILLKNIDCGYSLVPPRWGGSNEYPQSMFWAGIWKISEFFVWKISLFWL